MKKQSKWGLAALILSAPALAWFPKEGQAGTLTRGQIKAFVENGTVLFEDGACGRLLHFSVGPFATLHDPERGRTPLESFMADRSDDDEELNFEPRGVFGPGFACSLPMCWDHATRSWEGEVLRVERRRGTLPIFYVLEVPVEADGASVWERICAGLRSCWKGRKES